MARFSSPARVGRLSWLPVAACGLAVCAVLAPRDLTARRVQAEERLAVVTWFTFSPDTALAQYTQQGPKLLGWSEKTTQGLSVSLSADGNTALVGSFGGAWIWTRAAGGWTEGPRLVGSGEAGTARQGLAVALSGDGKTAVIGGANDDGGVGAAWVFTRGAGGWSQQGPKLVGMGAAGLSSQGQSVALSADGNTALIGGDRDDGIVGGSSVGAVWVWTRIGGVWSQQGPKLVAADAIGNAAQGRSVALSGDGNTALIGGPNDDKNEGAVWVWTRNNGVWTRRAKLVRTDSVGRFQGTDVAVSADGKTALVGGFVFPGGKAGAWVWTRTDGVWTPQGAELVGFDVVPDSRSGQAVDLSADGNTALIGSHNEDNSLGAAWVWTRSNGVWTQQGPKLRHAGGTEFALGYSVALSGSGDTALVGEPGNFVGGSLGSAWVWTRSDGEWTQQGGQLVGGLGPSRQGRGVAFSADGRVALVGGPDDDAGTGAVWVWGFDSTPPRLAYQIDTLVGAGAVGAAEQGTAVALSADGTTSLVGGAQDNGGTGAVWVWTWKAVGGWTQQGPKLVGAGAVGQARQGTAVALSADGNTALVGGPGDNSNTGAIWVWTRSNGVWTQQGSKLVGIGAVGPAMQGQAVGLAGVGNTAIVGGPMDQGGSGAVWVWTRTGGLWTQQGSKLVGTGSAGNARQGSSVALSGDGATAVVGGPLDHGQVGAAWIWTLASGQWVQQGGKLVGPDHVGQSEQGSSVSVSGDGTTAIVGGGFDDSGAGAVWVWSRGTGGWDDRLKLVGSGAAGRAGQGHAATLSADGTRVLVGGPDDQAGVGAAWVFVSEGPGAFGKRLFNGSLLRAANQVLSWDASPGAQYYEYCYDDIDNDACDTQWRSTGSATSVTLSGLLRGWTYYWQVRASAGGTTYADDSSLAFWSFITEDVPGPFVKESPTAGAVGQPSNPQLRWDTSPFASSYEYCVDTIHNNQCDTSWTSTGSSRIVRLSGLVEGTPYYWHVRAVNDLGVTYSDGSQTAFRRFTTIDVLPFAIGQGPHSKDGGWFQIRRGKAADFEGARWLQVPWDAYNRAGREVHPAFGDVDGDGRDEVVLGLGAGGGGWIAVLDDASFDYRLLKWIQVQWVQYNQVRGEVFPAVADLDGDGRAEIVAGLGPGGNGWIEIFDDKTRQYQHLAWRRTAWTEYNAGPGPTHPAAADLDGDGVAEIVIGLGPGGEGRIEVLDNAGGDFAHKAWMQVPWPAYNAANGATFPAAGDVDADGTAEIVVGLGDGGYGWVEVVDDAVAGHAHLNWLQVSWSEYAAAAGEVHPAVGNLDDDAAAEVVFGLASFAGNGGWFEIRDDGNQGFTSLGWRNLDWAAFKSAGGATWPAIGKLPAGSVVNPSLSAARPSTGGAPRPSSKR